AQRRERAHDTAARRRALPARFESRSEPGLRPVAAEVVGVALGAVRKPHRGASDAGLADIEGLALAANPAAQHDEARFGWPKVDHGFAGRERIDGGLELAALGARA